MIHINLLPADLRRGNRLPPRVLAAAFAAAALVSAAVGWFGLVYFGDLAAAEAELEARQATFDQRQSKVGYFDMLQVNRKDYALRVQTILEISKSRRLWSKFLDELIDVVNNNGDAERHLAWFDGITVKNDPKNGDTVKMPANVQDSDKARLANFHEDLEAAVFAVELKSKSAPSYKLEMDPVRIPPASLNFPLELQFKPAAGK